MKKGFKLLTLLLALLMVLPLAIACGENNQDDTQTTATIAAAGDTAAPETQGQEEDAYVHDRLPENLNFNVTLTTLYADDYTMTEFFAEEKTGDAIDDEIFKRNAETEERLGVKLEFVGYPGGDKKQDGFLAKAQADAQAGANAEYDIYAGYSRTIPLLQLDGLCANLLDTTYFDLEMPWWPKALTDELVVNNKLFFCTGDISTNLLWMMSALFFNTQMWESSNFDSDPYTMVQSNQWTLDIFTGLIKDYYQDSNGDTKVDADDIFGLSAYNACLDAFQNSCGVISVEKNANGALCLSEAYKGDRMVTIVEKCGVLFTSPSVHHSSTSNDEKNIFINGHSLFLDDALYVIKGKDNGKAVKIDLSYGLVPLPKLDENQDHYITNVRYPFNMYAISTMSKNTEAASATLECLGSLGYRYVTPMVFEGAMKMRYSADSTTSMMYDILREGVCFDLGRIYGYALDNYYPKFRNTALAGGLGWASVVKGIQVSADKKLAEIMATFED